MTTSSGYSGYVLDFCNDRFAAYFNRDLKIDIYHDRYAIHGTSKGNHLRAFLEIAPNADVVRTLTALWEYREAGMIDRGEAETLHNARQRLNNLLVKLGGKPLPADPTAAPPPPPPMPEPKGPSENLLAAFGAGILGYDRDGRGTQQRGYASSAFSSAGATYGADAHASFRTVGEQIDGSFQHDGSTYLVEAKWHTRPVDAAMLHGFQGTCSSQLQSALVCRRIAPVIMTA